MSKSVIQILITDGPPKKSGTEASSLMDKVCEYIAYCKESESTTCTEYRYLKQLYKKLKNKKLPSNLKPLLSKLEKFLQEKE